MDSPTRLTKVVTCLAVGCAIRRRHHEDPYTPRGPVTLEVPADHPGPWYCSIECEAYGKTARYATSEEAQAAGKRMVEKHRATLERLAEH